jgi:hypothetical protein
MNKTVFTKQEAIDMLRRWGTEELVRRAERELPDVIDLTRDGELMASYGMTRSQLMERAGGSP